MRDIGTARQGDTTVGFGINDNDEVVGFTNGIEKPFYWRGATGMRALRTLGGPQAEVYAINNSGAIVGSCQTPANIFTPRFGRVTARRPPRLRDSAGGTY